MSEPLNPFAGRGPVVSPGPESWTADDLYAALDPVDPNPWTPPEPEWDPLPGVPGETGPGRLRRWAGRLVPRSLASRLVVGVSALVLLIVLLVGGGTYYALRSYIYGRLDQQLATTASPGPLNLLFRGTAATPSGTGPRSPQDVWVVFVDSDGSIISAPSSATVEPMELSSSTRASLATRATTKPLTITTADGRNLRITVESVNLVNRQTGEQQSAIAIVGLSTDEATNTLQELVVRELVIGAVALVLAIVASAGGVRLSLRRLHRVTDTAREVAAELSPSGSGLDRRVPVHEAGTEVGQLAESMNTLLSAVEMQFAARLESEDRMRQFLADASHELRTPLTSIRGYAELARMQEASGEPADYAGSLARIENEGTRMSRLVDDLLTLARADRADEQRAPVAPVDMTDVVHDAVDGARASYPDRQIDVSGPLGLLVSGDYDALLRVVRNLVNNAAVHTRPGGPIRVTAAGDGGQAVILVSDAGPGLPPAEAAHVFERFWRADKARTRARGGSGLGLSIVSSIVAAHGGTVAFDSTVDTGSTVTVRLPRSTT